MPSKQACAAEKMVLWAQLVPAERYDAILFIDEVSPATSGYDDRRRRRGANMGTCKKDVRRLVMRAARNALAWLAMLVLAASPARAQEPGEAPPEFEAFGELVVGTWIDEGARIVNEWGVGRKAIRSEGYFLVDGAWKLVSEGLWYWDADAGTIRSVVVAIDMPVERFEYQSRVEGSRVVHDLRVYGPEPGRFVEIWSFDGDGYEYWLETPGGDGSRILEGSFRREGGSSPPS